MDSNTDKSFMDTTKLILGKSLAPTEKYSNWLVERIAKSETVNSVFGTGNIFLPDYAFFWKIPKGKIASFADLLKAETKKINEIDANETITNLIKRVKAANVDYFVPAFVEGNNINVKDTMVYLNCINVYNSFDIFNTRNSAHIFSTIDSEALFGCYRVMASKFCIHCYNITNLSACFEIDLARNCSNSMFCHNVENVHNSMFCFNVKNKSWAIGNVEVGRENYLRIKEIICKQLVSELEANGRTSFDIYSAI